MSEYSELLRRYVEMKEIKIEKLAQYCNMERSSVYKIINGKRSVKRLETAQKIANYMQLSPKECEGYYEAYYKNVLGEYQYEERQQIENFICSFHDGYSNGMQGSVGGTFDALEGQPAHILRGTAEINCYIKLLLEKAAQKENARIRLLTQCENPFLRDTLLTIGMNRPDLKIFHILCFQKDSAKENIDLLKNVIPFYTCECQYEPHYFYDEVQSHYYNMNMFCNVLICEEGILCFTSDDTYGQILTPEEFVQAYKDLFKQYWDKTYPMLTRVGSIIEEYMSVGQDVLRQLGQAKAYSLHAEPCAIPFVWKGLLEKQLRGIGPQKEQLKKIFWQYICEERNFLDAGRLCSSFTLRGIEKFIDGGRMEEIPEDFYERIEKADCLEIVKKMLPYIENGTYRILRNRLSEMNSKLHVFAAPTTGHLLFQKNEKELVYVCIKEPGMIRQFFQYMEGLNEEVSLYSPGEAVGLVRQLIEKYENEKKF